ncbi:MAG: AzlC family ABC transporter permease [Synergistales bacterium]|nr:AzlC family ABC transporter permease [Synergistales bacterium]
MSWDREEFRRGFRSVLPFVFGVFPFAVVAGVAAIETGLNVVQAVGMSMIVFAGASQLAVLQLLQDGAPFVIILATGLIVNLRFMMYSASIASLLDTRTPWTRPLLAYMLIDQPYAMTLARAREDGDGDYTCFFLGAGVFLWGVWEAGSLLGALLGDIIPPSLSLGFAVPLTFTALLIPNLKARSDVAAAVAGGLAAAIFVPIVPLRAGLILAIFTGIFVGVVAGPRLDRRGEAPE